MGFTQAEILEEFVDAEGLLLPMPLDVFARFEASSEDVPFGAGLSIYTVRISKDFEPARKRYRQRQRARGLCTACPEPVAFGRRRCLEHLRKDVERAKRYQAFALTRRFEPCALRT